jgi:hypothetical protein
VDTSRQAKFELRKGLIIIRQSLQSLLKLLLSLLGIFVAVVVAELATRWLGTPLDQRLGEMYQCDQGLGWRGNANQVMPVNTDGYRHDVVRNSQGMHDTEHQLEKGENTFRVLMLGDSFVDAYQVNETETSHQRLEDALNALSTSEVRFEVINAGLAGWGPAQELVYFRSEGQQYKPDLILALWVPANDLLDILPDYYLTQGGMNCYAPYFAICEGEFDSEPWFSAPGIRPTWKNCPGGGKKLLTRVLNQLYYSSRLYQHLEPVLSQGYHRIEYAHPYAPWLPTNQTDAVLQYAYQLTAETYMHLAVEGRQIGAKTALVIVPVKQAVYAEIDPNAVMLLQSDLEGLQPTLPNQVFTELMQSKRLPTLDLHPDFVQHLQQEDETLYWEADSHWNIRGNQLAAELIAAWLIEEKLVPVSY